MGEEEEEAGETIGVLTIDASAAPEAEHPSGTRLGPTCGDGKVQSK